MSIDVKNISKIIKKNEVLTDINMRLESGKVYGFQGRNGSGKTMLMRIICGLIRPTAGQVTINGKILGQDMSFPESVGVLIESPSFIGNCTGRKNLEFLAEIQQKIGVPEINEAIQKVGLDPDDKKKYRKYSLGMKQRLGIAAAIMEKPDILILDEPTNALDEKGVELVRILLNEAKENNQIIILSCHDKDELEYLSDEIYKISEGRIVSHLQKTEEGTW